MANFKILITICLIHLPFMVAIQSLHGGLLNSSCFAYNFNSGTRCEVSVSLVPLHSVITLCCKYTIEECYNTQKISLAIIKREKIKTNAG